MMQRFSPPVCTCVLLTLTTLILSGCGGSSVARTQNGNMAQGAPPTVSAVATQVNGVAPNREQEVQFSEAMDASTI
jgi:hypothetical protein